MNGIKILIAIMQLDIGGAETHVLELCKALKKKGLEVYVASNGGAYEKELIECGVTHYKVPLHTKQPFNMIGAYRALKKIIVDNDIRLVHAHARIPAFLCGILHRKLNFRFVTTAHWVFKTKFPYNLLSNWGEKSLAVSVDIKEYLIRHYRVPKDNIFVTINGIDTDKFSPTVDPPVEMSIDRTTTDPPVEMSIDRTTTDPSVKMSIDQTAVDPSTKMSVDSVCIMHLSRLDRDRSYTPHLLIESAPALLEQYPNLVIYIVGGGDDFENVRAKAEAVNAKFNKVIIMTGPQVDVHRWVAMCDIFVGCSRSILEAMAAGKPVIGSGNEGYIGLISEESLPTAVTTNFCYRGCGDVTREKLTRDLTSLLDKPTEERVAMGSFGRDFVLENYSVDRMADDAINLYRTVLATPSPLPVKKTDIMISGYYGHGNSGDDLILKSMIRDLKIRREDLSITVLSYRPRKTRLQYGVNAIYRFNFLAIRRLLRRTKLLLTGGGTLIQDLTSTQSLVYYLWIIRTARNYGVKNMLYANGIGPIKYATNIERMQKELKKVDLITLREESARKLLEELHVTGPRIIVTADPVFSLPPPDIEEAKAELSALAIEPHSFICVSIRSWQSNPPGFELYIAQFADYVKQKYGYTILFISMLPSEDTEITKKAMSLMKEKAVFLEKPRNMDSIRGIVGLSALTLAMRLHTLIYAIDCGIPVIGLVYDPKIQWLMKSINQTFYTPVEDVDSEVLTDFADDIISDMETVSAQVKESGQIARELAMKNADLCMELFAEP